MDGEVRDAFFLRLAHKGVQQMEAIDLRLQLVVEHRLEGRHFGVHNEDVGRDACFSQFRPFVGHGHGQVVYVPFLQRLGYLVGTSPIGRCLHHAHHLRLRLQLAAVVVQVGHHRAEVHLQNGLVHLPFEVFAQDVEAELARTLYQDQFLFQLQLTAGNGFEQCLCVGIESFLNAEAGSTRRDVRPYADDALHAAAVHQLGHTTIERRCILPRLQDVGQDERALQPLGLRAPVLEVEGYVERAQVAVITIVDQQAAVLAFLHLQTHGHRLQPRHPFLDLLRRKHQVEASRQAVQRVLDGSIVDERQRKLVVHVQIAVGYQRAVVLLLHLRDEERPFGVLTAPRYLARGKQRLGHAVADEFVVAVVDQHVAVLEERQLLHALLLQRIEVLLMGASDVGQDADGRLDDGFQRPHFARFGDARLEDGQLVVRPHLPDGQRYTDLRIVAARRAHDATVVAQQLVEPFLHHRLAVTARDAHHGDAELRPVQLRQLLQSLQGRRNKEKIQ